MIDLHLYIYIYMCEYNIDYELIENQYCLTDYNKLFSRSNLLVWHALFIWQNDWLILFQSRWKWIILLDSLLI